MLSVKEAVLDLIIGYKPTDGHLRNEYPRYAGQGIYPRATQAEVAEAAEELKAEGRVTYDGERWATVQQPPADWRSAWDREQAARRAAKPQQGLF